MFSHLGQIEQYQLLSCIWGELIMVQQLNVYDCLFCWLASCLSGSLSSILSKLSHSRTTAQLSQTRSLRIMGLPRWCSGKIPTCQCRRLQRHGFNPSVGKIPWRRKWTPTPVFLPVKFHGQKSLVGYSLWCRKESDMTERTHTHTHTHTHRIVSTAQEQVSEHIYF